MGLLDFIQQLNQYGFYLILYLSNVLRVKDKQKRIKIIEEYITNRVPKDQLKIQ